MPVQYRRLTEINECKKVVVGANQLFLVEISVANNSLTVLNLFGDVAQSRQYSSRQIGNFSEQRV